MHSIVVKTLKRTEFVNITAETQTAAEKLAVNNGVLTVFVPHTTAGITINENADPDVTADMEQALDRIVPWNLDYRHCEGNSAAHVKASIMGNSVSIIVRNGRLKLGTWQAVYFCEFDGPRSREVWFSA